MRKIVITLSLLCCFSATSLAQDFELFGNTDNCGCGVMVFMGLNSNKGNVVNQQYSNTYANFLQVLTYDYYKKLRERSRAMGGSASKWFTPFNETSMEASDDVKEEEFQSKLRAKIRSEQGVTHKQSSTEFWESVSTMDNSENYVNCIKACREDVIKFTWDVLNENTVQVSFIKNSAGVCIIDGLSLEPKDSVLNYEDVVSEVEALKSGFTDIVTLNIQRENVPLAISLRNRSGCILKGIVPAYVEEVIAKEDDEEMKPFELELGMAGGKNIVPRAGNDNPGPDLYLEKIGNLGGYSVESRNPRIRENGVSYIRVVKNIPLGYGTLTLSAGQGEVKTYDRISGKLLTIEINKGRPYVVKKGQEKEVSKMDYKCRFFLGERTEDLENLWKAEGAFAGMGTKGNEEHRNPRIIYGVDKSVDIGAEITKVTCICRYRDARRDDYHEIWVPYVKILLTP